MFSNFCLIQDIRTREIIGRGIEKGGLYYVEEAVQTGSANLVVEKREEQLWLWHRRLGHPSIGYLKQLFPNLHVSNLVLQCQTCIKAKSHRTHYSNSMNKVTLPFSLIHSDVWGPAPITSLGGHRWFVTFIDNCTRMTWVYFLKHKSEVADVFIAFYAMIHQQFSVKIQILRSDNGGEFVNHSLKDFFTQHGIIHETTCSHTPQQNGVAERKNRHILEITRALMFEACVPKLYWVDAISTAVYLMNWIPSRFLRSKTPLHILSTHFFLPSVLMLPPRIFSCSVYVHIPEIHRTKLDPCAVKCIFLGYGVHQKGYKCYDPVGRKFYVTMDVNFVENEYFFNHSPLQGEKENTDDEHEWLIYQLSDIDIQGEHGSKQDHEELDQDFTDNVQSSAPLSSNTTQSPVDTLMRKEAIKFASSRDHYTA